MGWKRRLLRCQVSGDVEMRVNAQESPVIGDLLAQFRGVLAIAPEGNRILAAI